MKSFGSDPEFMIVDKKDNHISAIKVLEVDKKTPILKKGHGFYWDNVLAECSIKPGFSKEEVITNFRECFKEYAKLVKPYKLKIQASQDFPASEMRHKGAKMAGCDPEYCVYQAREFKPPARIIEKTNFRTCGGHIHLGDSGCVSDDNQNTSILVRLLDLFLGIPSLFMDLDPTSPARRKLYGKAGRIRIKDYGVEYRSLGNFWLASPKLVDYVYDVCDWTIKFVDNGQDIWDFDLDKLLENEYYPDSLSTKLYDQKKLREAINKSDKNKAKLFFPIIQKYLPKQLLDRMSDLTTHFNFYKEWNIE